jgi:hypothetical protein
MFVFCNSLFVIDNSSSLQLKLGLNSISLIMLINSSCFLMIEINVK